MQLAFISMALKSKISVLIISAKQTFYKGEAYAVSSTNEVGPFDILEGHRDFICLVAKKVTVYKTASEVVDFNIDRGVLTVKDNQVRIYLGI